MISDQGLLGGTRSVILAHNNSSDMIGNYKRKTFSSYLKSSTKASDDVCEPKTVQDVMSIVTEKVQALQRADVLLEKKCHRHQVKPGKSKNCETVTNLMAEYEEPKHRFGSNLVSDTQMVEFAEGVEAMLQVMAKSNVNQDKPYTINTKDNRTNVTTIPLDSTVRDTKMDNCNDCCTIHSPYCSKDYDVTRRSRSVQQDFKEKNYFPGNIDPISKNATHVDIDTKESVRTTTEQKQSKKVCSINEGNPAGEAILTSQDLIKSKTIIKNDSISKQGTEPTDKSNNCVCEELEHSQNSASPILTSTKRMPQQVLMNLSFDLEHFQTFEDAQSILRVKSPFFYASPDSRTEEDTNLNSYQYKKINKYAGSEILSKRDVLAKSNAAKDSLSDFVDNKDKDEDRDDLKISLEINECQLRSELINVNTQKQQSAHADSQNMLECNISDDVIFSSDEECNSFDVNNHLKKELGIKNSHLYVKPDIGAFSDVSNFTDISGSTILSIPPKIGFTCQKQLGAKKILDSNNKSSSSHFSFSQKNEQFQGFQTANNKHISISDTAYEKTLDIFKDLDKDMRITAERNYQHTKANLPNLSRNEVEMCFSHKSLKMDENIPSQVTSEKQFSKCFLNVDDPFAEDIRCSQFDLIVTSINSQSDPETYTSTKSTKDHSANTMEREIKEKYSLKIKNVDKDLMSSCKNPLKVTKFVKHPLLNPPCDAIDCYSFNAHDTGGLQKKCIDDGKMCSIELPLFQTASNKNIIVSKDALINTKHLFDNIDGNFEQLYRPKHIVRDSVLNENQSVKNNVNDNCAYKSTDAFKQVMPNNINYVPKDLSNIRLNDNEKLKSLPSNDNREIEIDEEPVQLKNAHYTNQDKTSVPMNINADDHSSDAHFTKNNCGESETLKSSSVINAPSNISKAMELNEHTKDKKLLEGSKSNLKDSLNISAQDCIDKKKNCGFQTASNKKVYVTTEALKKVNDIFSNIDLDPKCTNFSDVTSTDQRTESNKGLNFEFNHPRDSDLQLVELSGFQTAGNSRITVSREAVKAAENIFNDLEINDNHWSCRQLETTDQPIESHKVLTEIINTCTDNYSNIQKASYCGFQTGNNTIVDASNSAFNVTRNLLAHATKSKIVSNTWQKVNYNKENVPDPGLKRSEEITNITCRRNSRTDNSVHSFPSKTVQFSGFETASRKKVHISDAALIKTKNLFQNIDPELQQSTETPTCENACKVNSRIDNSVHNFPSKTEKFSGFETASRKMVHVSDEALIKTKDLFQNIDQELQQSAETPTCENACKINSRIDNSVHSFPSKTLKFTGFETASRKKVHISDEALIKTKNLFQNVDQELQQSAEPSFENATLQKVQEESKHELSYIEQTFQIEKNNCNASSKDLLLKSKCTVVEPMNTQVISNFNETLYTEDFCDKYNSKVVGSGKQIFHQSELPSSDLNVTENVACENKLIVSPILQSKCSITKNTTKSVSKRSGSPILSFPKAKKRKTALFSTPYKVSNKVPKTDLNLQAVNANCKDNEEQSSSLDFIYDFDNTYKKCHEKIALKNLGPIQKEKNYPHSLQCNIDDVLNNQFVGPRNDLNSSTLTTECIKKIFLNSVKKKIVPDQWVENHMKMIIWKLISYEICYPDKFENILTVKNVLEQLKYRYDKELYNVERPALRKILERDDSPTKLLVLCVTKIFQDGNIVFSAAATTNLELELTDGWYCIKTSIDKLLSKAIIDGKIVVGTKLVTHGAELLNCDQGKSPLEDISNVRLKIHGNSTRRVPYWSKLGYRGNGTLLVNMASVLPEGGKISKMTAFVSRVYPMLYVEKFEDGSTVTRSERLENIHLTKFERERDAKLEKIYEEVEKEFHDEMTDSESCENDSECRKREYESGSQIAKMMKKSRDPLEFRANLTNSQSKLLSDYTNKMRDKALQDIQERIREKIDESGVTSIKRNVIQLLKVRLIGFKINRNSCCEIDHNLLKLDSSLLELKSCNCQIEVTKCMMSVWKPNENVTDILQEGSFVSIFNCIPTAIRMSEVHISAGRQTVFKKSNEKDPLIVKKSSKYVRKVLSIEEIVKNPCLKTEFNEVDIVGLIFEISPSNVDFEILPRCKRTFQNVYICDKSMNLICVNFWGGLSKFGYDKILQLGQFVACSNLQIRTGNTKRNIPEFRATEFTIITQHPKNKAQISALDTLKGKFANDNLEDYCKQCVEQRKRISQKNDFSPYRVNNSYEKNKVCIKFTDPGSPYISNPNLLRKRPIADLNDSNFPKAGSHNNASNKICNYQEEYNLSLEDFESTFRHTQDNSCKAKNPKVESKISKLKMYGDPPPLNPIPILNKTKRVELAYVSPVSNQVNINDRANSKFETVESPKSSRVSIENIITEDSLQVSGGICDKSRESSPILVRKTRHFKSNPKRIDTGSINLNNSTDVLLDCNQFSEDFDFSPPLSLD